MSFSQHDQIVAPQEIIEALKRVNAAEPKYDFIDDITVEEVQAVMEVLY